MKQLSRIRMHRMLDVTSSLVKEQLKVLYVLTLHLKSATSI